MTTAALATDAGWFRFGSVESETYRVAAKLIDAGAQPDEIYRELYERDTLGRVRLRGLVLSRLVTELEGALAYTYILNQDYQTSGARPSDTEDLVNLALAISGTQAAVIFIEQLTGGFKVSFRSRCELDCSEVAGEFGGGGHHAAAGAFIRGEFADVQPRVLEAVRKRLAKISQIAGKPL